MADDERMGDRGVMEPAHSLVRIELDEAGAPRRSAEAEHERAIAIYDILEDNRFALVDQEGALLPDKGDTGKQGPRLIFFTYKD